MARSAARLRPFLRRQHLTSLSVLSQPSIASLGSQSHQQQRRARGGASRSSSSGAGDSSTHHASGSAQGAAWKLFAGLASTAGAFALVQAALNANTAAAKEPEPLPAADAGAVKQGSSVGWRKRMTENYNKRIQSHSTPEKVFNTFASIEVDAHTRYMTYVDFAEAVLPARPNANRRALREEDVPSFFSEVADIDGDGRISFPEFLLFTSMLAIPESDFDIAFKMFDYDSSGEVDFPEFQQFIDHLRPGSMSAFSFSEVAGKTGLVRQFFGPKCDQTLSFAKFRSVLLQLRDAVLLMEFNTYDTDRNKRITERQFAEALISYAPFEAHARLEAKAQLFAVGGEETIHFDDFVVLDRVLARLDRIAHALRLYHGVNGALTKTDFERAVWNVTGLRLNPSVLHTLFVVWGSGSGAHTAVHEHGKEHTLALEDLLQVMQRRYTFGMDKPRDTGFLRFLGCCADCARTTPIGELVLAQK